MKNLIIDLETSPNVAHVWSLWNNNVSLAQLRESGRVISFAAKWYGSKKVEFWSDHHDGHEAMINRAHELLDEADCVTHFNGVNFDMRWLRREFIQGGLTPPSPWKDIDLLTVVKKNFRFASNKLQHVSTELGLAGKVSHTGHDLWVRCMAGDDSAWSMMRKYNKQDVVLTEELYDKLLPWIGNHPHRALYDGVEVDSCQRCGKTSTLQRRGYAYSTLGKYQRFQCLGCGSWSRGAKRVATVDARGVQ